MNKAKEALDKRFFELQEELRVVREDLQKMDEEETNKKLSSYIGKCFLKDKNIFVRCEKVENYDVHGTEIWSFGGEGLTVNFHHGLMVNYWAEDIVEEISVEVFEEELKKAQDLIIFNFKPKQ